MADTALIEENQRKLELETHSLRVLKDMSQKCCIHTTSIRSILSEFDNRLAKLEKIIQPVYKETGNLQSKQSNLVSTLEKLDYVIQFYSVTSEVEYIIRSGPANQLEHYMKCLNTLEKAEKYFYENNRDSPEYSNVKSLSDHGYQAVEKEFKQVLQRYSSIIAPIALLDIINDDISEQHDSTHSGNTTNTSNSGMSRRQYSELPPDKIKDLRLMCYWLCQKDSDKFVPIYAELRSEYICKSLKSLQDYQKSRSIGPLTSGSSGGGSSRVSIESPDLGANKKNYLSSVASSSTTKDPIFKRTPKSIQMAFKRKFHNVMPGDVTHKSNTGSIDEISITEREIVSYLTCISGFLKLAANEQDLMSSIIPADIRTPIFNDLIQPSLGLICTEANNLTSRVKKSVNRRDFKSSLSLFPILKHQIMRRHNFDLLFTDCHSEVLSRFQGLTVTFHQTIYVALSGFDEFVRTDTDSKVPDDGTVHELTNNVMIFIEQLSEYLDICANIVPNTEAQPSDNQIDGNRFGFAQYVTKLLAHLGLTLQEKSKSYNPSSELVSLFKLNNYHYILKRLRDSGLMEIIHSYNDRADDLYIACIDDERREYLDKVDLIAKQLPDARAIETRAKQVKEAFTNFNTKFQEFHRCNRRYAVPDFALKTQLREESKKIIVPRYTMFYERFANGDFFRNKEKYVKYDPRIIENLIDEFFEAD